MSQPILLLDEHRHIHYRRREASELIAATDSLHDESGLLCCRRPVDDKRLLSELKEMLSPRHEGLGIRRRVIRLGTFADNRPIVVLLDRLLPEPTMQAFGHQPLAFVVLHTLGSSRSIDPFIVAQAFSLTPAEAQVTVLLAEGMSPEQIAEKRYASMPTVRSQLRALFEKVGVTRQIDLVRLVREMPNVGIAV